MSRLLQLALASVVLTAGARPVRAESPGSFDLATFTPPAGWTSDATPGGLRLTHVDKKTKSYCQLMLFKSIASSGDPGTDFDKDWRALIAERYTVTKGPTSITRPKLAGWTVRAGAGRIKLPDHAADVSLTTYSGNGAAMSVLSMGNHARCQRAVTTFVAGLKLQAAGIDAGAGVAAGPASSAPRVAEGFQFTSSSFDDGWVATIQPDWVQVEKGDVKAFLYYVVPYDSTNFSGTGVMERDYYWDRHVATQFQATTKAYRDDGESVGSLKPKYVEGWGVDRVTGQRRFLAMHLGIGPNAAMITLASAPDEAALRAQFPKANDRWASDLATMSRYNKFAVGAKDLVGTWQSGGSQMTQWYDAQTGNYAGATFAASSATFTFGGTGSYRSIHNGATGAVGAMGTFQQEYKGTYQVANWSVTATNRYQGKTHALDAHFQIVRGGRLLFLDDKRGGSYLLVRTSK